MTLNLGCGDKHRQGAVNVDKCVHVHPDVCLDIDKLPWPWEDNSFSEVWAEDILEHVNDFMAVMAEIHRVMVAEGVLHVRSTYWQTENSFRDPTHRRFLTFHSFDYFDPGTEAGSKYWWYAPHKFKVVQSGLDGQETIFTLICKK